MTVVNGFNIGMSGIDRLVALLNAPGKLLELTPESATILDVKPLARTSTNTIVHAQIDLNVSLSSAIAAGFKAPTKTLLERKFYIYRESGADIHRKLENPCLGLKLTLAATNAQIIDKLNTVYGLGIDARDVLIIERTNNLAKLTFKVSSITYTGYLSLDITGDLGV